jgi:hypothetical protein
MWHMVRGGFLTKRPCRTSGVPEWSDQRDASLGAHGTGTGGAVLRGNPHRSHLRAVLVQSPFTGLLSKSPQNLVKNVDASKAKFQKGGHGENGAGERAGFLGGIPHGQIRESTAGARSRTGLPKRWWSGRKWTSEPTQLSVEG